jgi:hypothetical protein
VCCKGELKALAKKYIFKSFGQPVPELEATPQILRTGLSAANGSVAKSMGECKKGRNGY